MSTQVTDLERARRMLGEMDEDEDQEVPDIRKILRLVGCHEEVDASLHTAVYIHRDFPELNFSVNLSYHGVPQRKWRGLRDALVRYLAVHG